MNTLTSITNTIRFIVDTNKDKDFLKGDCFLFHRLLKESYPESVPFYDGNHIFTFLYGRMWDCRGLRMYPLEAEPRIAKDAHKWSSK